MGNTYAVVLKTRSVSLSQSQLYKMPKMTMTKASKGNAKLLPVKITTMDAELEFKIEV